MFHRRKMHRRMRGPHRHGWDADFGHHWGRGRHGGGRRMFDQGDLRLVVLALLGDQPRHGYELIKEIADLSGGLYAPSPGVIYPLLTMLDELGLAQLEASDGAKKLYALTTAGQEELTAKRGEAEQLLGRLAAAKDRSSGGRAPQIVRAVENFRTALRLRLNRGPLNEEEIKNIAVAIDAAAAAVERS
jgi:DNA-binding PadR family transcriptional regulator